MLNRRTLLASSAIIPLAGCAGMGTDASISAIARDASILASGLMGAIAQLGSLAIPATVSAALAGLQSVADALSTVASQSAALPLVQKIESYVNVIVQALASIPLLPAPVTLALQAATILLPIIEAAVGMVLPASSMRAKLAPSNMSPSEARLILIGAAKKAP